KRKPDGVIPNGLNVVRFQVMYEFRNVHSTSITRTAPKIMYILLGYASATCLRLMTIYIGHPRTPTPKFRSARASVPRTVALE
ncbi:hypothetical protein BDZ89DRAFT_974464, partial [Hymenopellis radicata]